MLASFRCARRIVPATGGPAPASKCHSCIKLARSADGRGPSAAELRCLPQPELPHSGTGSLEAAGAAAVRRQDLHQPRRRLLACIFASSSSRTAPLAAARAAPQWHRRPGGARRGRRTAPRHAVARVAPARLHYASRSSRTVLVTADGAALRRRRQPDGASCGGAIRRQALRQPRKRQNLQRPKWRPFGNSL